MKYKIFWYYDFCMNEPDCIFTTDYKIIAEIVFRYYRFRKMKVDFRTYKKAA